MAANLPAPLFTGPTVPALSAAGDRAVRRLIEFFTAEVRNLNARAAYARAVARFGRCFLDHRLTLDLFIPVNVATYVDHLGHDLSKLTVKPHLAACVAAAGIGGDVKGPLFHFRDRYRKLATRRLATREIVAMPKRLAKAAGLGPAVCSRTFRATVINNFLEHGGTVETAQAIAAHESPRTTKQYDSTADQLTLDESERIRE